MTSASAEKKLYSEIDEFYGAVYGIGLMLLSLETPSFKVLCFVDSSIRGLIDVLPEQFADRKSLLRRQSIEIILMMSLQNDSSSSVVTDLFDELCSDGFSSEQRVLDCTVEYCGWLKAHRRKRQIKSALNRVAKYIQHPVLVDQLNGHLARMGVTEVGIEGK